jgi:dTMP kinase
LDESRKRLSERSLDRIEKEAGEFHQKVRDGFLALAEREPDRFIILDGTAAVEEISEEIKHEITNYLKRGH